ncbi:MAG: hypothetical protein ACFFAN_15320 [Promethearchaeota archaeon]
MVENISLRHEDDIVKVFYQAVNLFRKTGLIDLAEKWQKILKNYKRRMSLR